MWAPLLLVAQTAAPAVPEVIDLLAPIRPLRCPEVAPDEIVVCGQRPGDEYRLFRRDTAGEDPGLPRAETRLFGNTRGAIETEAATLPQGAQSNRLMFRLKMPF